MQVLLGGLLAAATACSPNPRLAPTAPFNPAVEECAAQGRIYNGHVLGAYYTTVLKIHALQLVHSREAPWPSLPEGHMGVVCYIDGLDRADRWVIGVADDDTKVIVKGNPNAVPVLDPDSIDPDATPT
jgi:hypothetical protein